MSGLPLGAAAVEALPSVDSIRSMIADERDRAEAALACAREALARLSRAGVHPRRAVADSRMVRPGDLFLAMPGARVDGRVHAEAARRAGAVAVLEAAAPAGRWAGAPGSPIDARAGQGVSGLQLASGPIASLLLGDPSAGLWVVGVTGTNGKTSVSQWIAAALSAAGRTAGVIGTLGAGLAGEAGSALNTTPEACLLQDCIARLRERGADALAMEVSSIGLDQGRTLGVAFDCVVFTNLTRDHLDYHGDMQRYALAKARLLAAPSITQVVCNLDDPLGVRLLAALAGSAVTGIGYSMATHPPAGGAHRVLRATDVRVATAGTTFQLTDGLEQYPVFTTLVGQFNLSNLLAVAATLIAAGLALRDLPRLLEQLAPVPGRMQRIGGVQAPLALVDYAHTPDALERALAAARELARVRGGKVVVVFGCGGDRDPGKRAPMGEIAAHGADQIILTSDNPRSESPAAIVDQIAAGIAPGHMGLRVLLDRDAAIRAALAHAAGTDVVLVAGKGHETYQETAGLRQPFSDIDVVTQAIAAWPSC